jgi:hypothetical protein
MLLVRHARARRDAGLDWLMQVIEVGWPGVRGAARKRARTGG